MHIPLKKNYEWSQDFILFWILKPRRFMMRWGIKVTLLCELLTFLEKVLSYLECTYLHLILHFVSFLLYLTREMHMPLKKKKANRLKILFAFGY